MQDFNVVSLLTKFSGDVIVGAVVACVCALIVKKFFHSATKFLMILSFVCAFVLTFVIDRFAFALDAAESASGGVTAGALALTLTAFLKRTAFSDDKALKNEIEKLLSSIILSGNIDGVIDDILKKIKDNPQIDKNMIRSLLKDCFEGETDEKTLDILTDIVVGALGIIDSDDKNGKNSDAPRE